MTRVNESDRNGDSVTGVRSTHHLVCCQDGRRVEGQAEVKVHIQDGPMHCHVVRHKEEDKHRVRQLRYNLMQDCP